MKTTTSYKRIVIVGGGFASWYTAASFRHNFPDQEILVIDSDKVPRLGVGETLGFSAPYDIKRLLGLPDDREFMWHTGATYKYGITTTNYYADNVQYSFGKHFNLATDSLSKFYGEFDYDDFSETRNYDPNRIGIVEAWISLNKNTDKTLKDYIEETGEVAPFLENTWAPYDSRNKYVLRPSEGWAWHIDAEKTVQFYKRLATQDRDKVTHINSAVREIIIKDGAIDHLILENNDRITGDLYIDCTGFHRVLVSKINDTWWDADERFNNSAVVGFAKYTDPRNQLKSATRFFGEDHGWRFVIQLFHREGHGYVFNDRMTDPEIITKRLLEATEGRDLVPPRIIKWQPGYYKTPWVSNVLPLGVSALLLDPYDGPSYDLHSRSLEDFFKAARASDDISTQKSFYNESLTSINDDRVARLLLNFGLSKRSGDWWQSRRDLLKDCKLLGTQESALHWLQQIIDEPHSVIRGRYTWFLQWYYRLIVAYGLDRSGFKFPEIPESHKVMVEKFFEYNRARNQFTRQQQWPNYYEWLKENRFQGNTADQMLEIIGI